MELLIKMLFLCVALALANGDHPPPGDLHDEHNDTPHNAHAPVTHAPDAHAPVTHAPDAHAPVTHAPDAHDADLDHDHTLPDRCDGIEFDAITLDEKGKTFFFKDNYVWMGYHGSAHLSNEFFKELDDVHHIGHVDAAFRMHNEDNKDDHDHIYFFLDDQVFSYYNHTLENGYPKPIHEDFPGIPDHLDAAVECPKGECMTNSVLFFKGHDVYLLDLATKVVKIKTWPHMPVCTSALRWLEHYYCFHGHNFTRFNPVSGKVSSNYPKDARKYFMSCHGHSHGGDRKVKKCSEVKLDAVTADDAGKTYFFAGHMYMRQDTHRDGFHAFNITRMWPNVSHGVDAVFSYAGKIYMIKDDDIYIYKSAAHYILIENYPKKLKEELGVDGHVDAAFVCPGEHIVHVIQGKMLHNVDLDATPRNSIEDFTLSLDHIDAAMCNDKGINVFKDSHYFHYDNSTSMSGVVPVAQKITHEMMMCED